MLQAVVVAYRFDAVAGIKRCSTVGDVDSIWTAYDGGNEDSAVFSKLEFTQVFAAPVGVGGDLKLGEMDVMAQQSAGIGRPFPIGLELFFVSRERRFLTKFRSINILRYLILRDATIAPTRKAEMEIWAGRRHGEGRGERKLMTYATTNVAKAYLMPMVSNRPHWLPLPFFLKIFHGSEWFLRMTMARKRARRAIW